MYPNDDPDYAKQRLARTVIMHKGIAVLVGDVQRTGKDKPLEIISHEVRTGKKILDKIGNYDLRPIKLGFINVGTDSMYVTRAPLRNDWRQGFRFEQMTIHFNPSDRWINDYEYIARTAENDFPGIDEIRETLRRKVGLQAWCRSFAMNEKADIFYRGFGKIGEFTDVDERKFKLDNSFFWVERELKEHCNG